MSAAAGAAKIYGLDDRETTSAIAIAASQAGAMRAVLGSDAKPILAGRAAESGLQAAKLARAGVTGPRDPIEDGRGFVNLLNDGEFDHGAIEATGRTWRLVEPGISFKMYPSCSATHAAMDALAKILADNDLVSGDVARVDCLVPPLVETSLAYERPSNVTEAQFCLPFVLGCVLAFGGLDLRHLTQATLADPGLAGEMEKVSMSVADLALPAETPEGAEVTVATVDGGSLKARMEAARGMPQNPVTDADLEHKFLAQAGFAGISPAAAAGLLERLWNIETLAAAGDLFAGLNEEVPA